MYFFRGNSPFNYFLIHFINTVKVQKKVEFHKFN